MSILRRLSSILLKHRRLTREIKILNVFYNIGKMERRPEGQEIKYAEGLLA